MQEAGGELTQGGGHAGRVGRQGVTHRARETARDSWVWSDLLVQVAGCKVRVQGAGCRVQGAGCRGSRETCKTPWIREWRSLGFTVVAWGRKEELAEAAPSRWTAVWSCGAGRTGRDSRQLEEESSETYLHIYKCTLYP